MAKFLSSLILWLCTIMTYAQVINSLSSDKTGFYGHALDSVVSCVKQQTLLTKIYITGEACALNHVPEKIQDIPCEKILDVDEMKRMSSTEALFKISCISIIKYQVKTSISTLKQKGRRLTFLADGAYIFTYHYNSEKEEYFLKKLEKGIRL